MITPHAYDSSMTSRPPAPPYWSLRAMLDLRPAAFHVGHGGRLDPARVARWANREQRRLDRLDRRRRLVRRTEIGSPGGDGR
jgi:hypothetical protein